MISGGVFAIINVQLLTYLKAQFVFIIFVTGEDKVIWSQVQGISDHCPSKRI